MRKTVLWFALVAGAIALGALPASAATITASPATVAPGGSVTLAGDVLVNCKAGCGTPGTVTLISPAFTGLGEFAGVGAVNLPVDASGHFHATVTLSVNAPSGTQTITGRCGGGNLGVSATLTVGLPRTGGGVGPLSDTALAVGAFALLGAGATLVLGARRRVRAAGARP